jgi:hypothetical protein
MHMRRFAPPSFCEATFFACSPEVSSQNGTRGALRISAASSISIVSIQPAKGHVQRTRRSSTCYSMTSSMSVLSCDSGAIVSLTVTSAPMASASNDPSRNILSRFLDSRFAWGCASMASCLGGTWASLDKSEGNTLTSLQRPLLSQPPPATAQRSRSWWDWLGLGVGNENDAAQEIELVAKVRQKKGEASLAQQQAKVDQERYAALRKGVQGKKSLQERIEFLQWAVVELKRLIPRLEAGVARNVNVDDAEAELFAQSLARSRAAMRRGLAFLKRHGAEVKKAVPEPGAMVEPTADNGKLKTE